VNRRVIAAIFGMMSWTGPTAVAQSYMLVDEQGLLILQLGTASAGPGTRFVTDVFASRMTGDYSTSVQEYDCRTLTTRMSSRFVYDGTGAYLDHTMNLEGTWEPVIPQTYGETIARAVCFGETDGLTTFEGDAQQAARDYLSAFK